MTSHNDTEDFETIVGFDGKQHRILKDGRRMRISLAMRDAALGGYPGGRRGSLSSAPRGSREGDPCTENGWPGTLRRSSDGQLYCETGHRNDAFTDGRTNDPLTGCRPGFRIPATADRQPLRDAYASYEARLANAYKVGVGQFQCADCEGSGSTDDGNTCSKCRGHGAITDSSTRIIHFETQRSSDGATHQQRMAGLYDAYDQALANAWRTK
jgi:hypothetical protein